MHVIKMQAENFKVLQAVTIESGDEPVVQIAGDNGQGKSSVLRALWSALGGKSATPNDAVRHGAEEARLEVTLGEGDVTELVITKVIKADGSESLKIVNGEGGKFASGQTMLNSMVSNMADPLKLLRLKPRELLELVADVVGLRKALRTYEAERDKLFGDRTDVNRSLKSAQTRLAAMPEVPAVDPVDMRVAAQALRDAMDHNNSVLRETERRAAKAQQIDAGALRVLSLRKQALSLLDEAKELAEHLTEETQRLDDLPTIAAPVDIEPLQAALDEGDLRNAQHRAHGERAKLVADVAQIEASADELTATLQQMDAEWSAVVAAADLPVPGMTIADGVLKVDGVEFGEMSGAQQIDAACDIAMADKRVKIRFLYTEEGSKLGPAMLDRVYAKAAVKGWKVWLETVDVSGDVGIVLQDGMVAKVNPSAPAKRKAARAAAAAAGTN